MQENDYISNAIYLFKRLPGVGEKTAERFVYFLLRAPKEEALNLSQALKHLVEDTLVCSSCYNISGSNPCKICSSNARDKKKICIVESPLDIVSIEGTSVFDGIFFVLGGVIDPINGIGPEELRISNLIQKFEHNQEKNSFEIIFAFGPSLQSEATISYIINEFKKKNINNVKFSKLAQGLPSGADLQFTDSGTLSRAISGRIQIN